MLHIITSHNAIYNGLYTIHLRLPITTHILKFKLKSPLLLQQAPRHDGGSFELGKEKHDGRGKAGECQPGNGGRRGLMEDREEWFSEKFHLDEPVF